MGPQGKIIRYFGFFFQDIPHLPGSLPLGVFQQHLIQTLHFILRLRQLFRSLFSRFQLPGEVFHFPAVTDAVCNQHNGGSRQTQANGINRWFHRHLVQKHHRSKNDAEQCIHKYPQTVPSHIGSNPPHSRFPFWF